VAAADPPEPLGFPKCKECPLVQSGSAAKCYACAAKVLPQHDGPTCAICGQKLDGFGHCGNSLCRDPDRGFDKAHVIAVHRDELRDVNARHKYKGRTGWATIFGRIVVGYLDEHAEEFRDVGVIVPNPGHTRQHNERVIQAAGREDFWWPFDTAPWAVTKRMDTPRSANNTLTAKMQAALQHVDQIDVVTDRIRGKRVLIFDDVFTTGAQLHHVGRLLKQHGASSVEGLVLARAPWGGS
jgi:predicted amidophosphoribosyltransferase